MGESMDAAPNSGSSADYGAGAATGSGTGMSSEGEGTTSPPPAVIDDGSDPTGGGSGNVQPSVLTAGVWDDNRNYDFFKAYREDLQETLAGVLPISEAAHDSAYDRFAETPAPRQTLDISFVIDTTGSMMDEIAYLQVEFAALSDAIFAQYPSAEQRWSLVLYRDVGDDYVTQQFDFVSGKDEFQANLASAAAGGGGDFPEAPDQGLAKAAEFSWRAGADTARLAFWVGDAPHHEENAQALASAIEDLADLDIHVYPVASSGIDELTELTMRSAAQLTGGRYLFLTNDSGIGDDHKEPTIPCYFVTKLDSAILRVVDIELSGVYREPDADEIIRTGGDPEDGVCVLAEDRTVFVY
jgi:hypothetical protein